MSNNSYKLNNFIKDIHANEAYDNLINYQNLSKCCVYIGPYQSGFEIDICGESSEKSNYFCNKHQHFLEFVNESNKLTPYKEYEKKFINYSKYFTGHFDHYNIYDKIELIIVYIQNIFKWKIFLINKQFCRIFFKKILEFDEICTIYNNNEIKKYFHFIFPIVCQKFNPMCTFCENNVSYDVDTFGNIELGDSKEVTLEI